MTITIQQLMAMLGIDDVERLTVSGRLAVIQRDPQPDEEDISPSSGIKFIVVDLNALPEDYPTSGDLDFTVKVDSVLIATYSGGALTPEAGWSGTVTPPSSSAPYIAWEVEIEQTSPPAWGSEQLVDILLECHIGSPAGGWGHADWEHFDWGHGFAGPVDTGDFSWSFTTADVIPPLLVAAEAMDQFTVRLTFDDTMATSGAGSVLDESLWSITRHNVDPVPGVNLTSESLAEYEIVGSVSVPTKWTYADAAARAAVTTADFTDRDVGFLALQEGDSTYWMLTEIGLFSGDPVTWSQVVPTAQYDLTVNWEMTPDCLYRVHADGAIEDDAGNQINSDFVTAPFFGFQPEIPTGRRFSHWRMMVPLKNRQEDLTRDLERFSGCIQEMLGLLLYEVDRFTDQFDPDLCSDEVIDLMLQDMGNPFTWAELELTAMERRKLLRILIDIYKSKGTDIGIEQTVLFLLGITVRVVEYAADGWILGVDALGSNSIAQLTPLWGETWDLTTVPQPWELIFKVDSGVEQIVTLVPGDFADTSAATAAELVTAIVAQLAGALPYLCRPGQPAFLDCSQEGPYHIGGGETLELDVNGEPLEIIFQVSDFETPGAATREEVLARIAIECPEIYGLPWIHSGWPAGFSLVTRNQGTAASLAVTGGTVLTVLGWTGLPSSVGSDELSFSIYSQTPGPSASIELMNGSDDDLRYLLGFWETSAATGAAVLAPSDPYTLYSFDIEYDGTITAEEQEIIRKIAEYMKVAHTHLINIRPPAEIVWPEGWTLGVDELDVGSELMP